MSLARKKPVHKEFVYRGRNSNQECIWFPLRALPVIEMFSQTLFALHGGQSERGRQLASHTFFFFQVLVYCARCFVPKFDTLWNDTQSLLICICRGERGPRRRISPSETSGVQTQGALACSKRGGLSVDGGSHKPRPGSKWVALQGSLISNGFSR